MFVKTVVVLALLGVAAAHHAFSSQHVHKYDGHHQPIHHHGNHDFYTYPKYDFEYKVNDPHTGDHKGQRESRDGDVVKGFYWLHQPDGSIRHVDYHGDKYSGFVSDIIKFHATVKHSIHHIVPKHSHH